MWRNFFKPEHINWRRAFCLILGIYTHLFITLFVPYKNDKITYAWVSTYDYACHSTYNFINAVFFTALVTLILPKRFPVYFSPQNLSFQRFFMLQAIAPFGMGIFYFIGNAYYFHHEITFSWFFIFLFRVVFVTAFFAAIPFVTVYISIFNYFIGHEEKKIVYDMPETPFSDTPSMQDAEEKISETPPQYPHDLSTPRPIMLSFTDSANKKSLDVALNHLYYITSAQNYIEIFHKNDEVIKSTLMRQSLKTIEEDMILSGDLPLIRCHKAFIVNREKVVELRGTAKTAHFILADIETIIPVSRQKYPEIEAQFSN